MSHNEAVVIRVRRCARRPRVQRHRVDVVAVLGDVDRRLGEPRHRLRGRDRAGRELHAARPRPRRRCAPHLDGRLQRAPAGSRRGRRALDLPAHHRAAAVARDAAPQPPHVPAACPSSTSRCQLLGEWGIEPTQKLTEHATRSASTACSTARATSPSSAACSRTRASRSTSTSDDGETKLVLADAPQDERRARAAHRLPRPAQRRRQREHVTEVRVGRRVRPGQVHACAITTTAGRRATSSLASAAAARRRGEARALPLHARRVPVRERQGRGTPARRRQGQVPHATRPRATRSRSGASTPSAATRARSSASRPTCIDLAPGTVLAILDHPQRELGDDKKLLGHRVDARRARSTGDWTPPVRGAQRRRGLSARRCGTPKPKVARRRERDRGRARRRGDPHRRVRPRARPLPLGSREQDGRQQLVLDPREPALGRRRLRRHQPAAHRAGGASSTSSAAIPTGRSIVGPRLHQPAEDALQAAREQDAERLEEQLVARRPAATTRSCSRTRPAASSSACAPRGT